MKKLLTAICFIGLMAFSANQANAQIGLKGGIALGSINTSIGEFDESSDMKIGFTGGLVTQFELSDMIAIQPELLFTMKGGKEETEFFGEVTESSLTLSYVEVPVLLRFNIPLDGDMSPFLYAGPHAGFLIDATEDENGESIDVSDGFEDFNFGVSFGGGVDFGNFFVDVRYDLGLMNIVDVPEEFADFFGNDVDVTARAILITGGITF